MRIPPKCVAYFSGSIHEYDIEIYNITSIDKMVFAFSVTEDGSLNNNPELMWLPIKLSIAGTRSNETNKSNHILFDMNGIKVFGDSYKVDTNGDSIWEFTMVNETSDDISIQLLDSGGTALKSDVSDIKIGAKQYRKVQIRFFNKIVEDLEFLVVVRDFYGTTIKAKSDNLIKINNEAYISKGE